MEIWKKIKEFPNYKVSNLGNIKSINRYEFIDGIDGRKYKRLRLGVPLKIIPRKMSKYLTYGQVGLSNKNGAKCFHIHRIIAIAFIPNTENKPQVNHKDGNGLNNNIENLEWVTVSENGLHAYRILGRTVWCKGIFGEKAPTSRTVLQKTLEGKLIKKWGCASDAVRKFGFDSGGITKTCQNKQKYHKGFNWEYGK